MTDAIEHVFRERRRMLDALAKIGHADAVEIEPEGSVLGTRGRPFRLRSRHGKTIARFWVTSTQNGCRVHVEGTPEFMAALAATQRDESTRLH